MKKDKPEYFMPLSWWGQIISVLDGKMKLIAQDSGYGSLTFEVVMRKGEVKDIIFKDKVQIRQKSVETNLTKKDKA